MRVAPRLLVVRWAPARVDVAEAAGGRRRARAQRREEKDAHGVHGSWSVCDVWAGQQKLNAHGRVRGGQGQDSSNRSRKGDPDQHVHWDSGVRGVGEKAWVAERRVATNLPEEFVSPKTDGSNQIKLASAV